jgi:hypothetical protein
MDDRGVVAQRFEGDRAHPRTVAYVILDDTAGRLRWWSKSPPQHERRGTEPRDGGCGAP